MGKRVYQRVEVHGFHGDISDGMGFFPGQVSDISRFGLRMTDLPKRVNEKANRMTVVINGEGKNFKMLLKPKWSQASGMRKTVGFEIMNTPYEWTDFVLRREPKDDKDAWDVIVL